MIDVDVVLETGLPGDVRLRSLTKSDARAFAELVVADFERLSEYLGWPAFTTTAKGARAFIEPYAAEQDGRRLIAGIWVEGVLAGGVVLFRHDPAAGTIELGCWAGRAVEGRGVVRAACVEALRLARSWGVERVQWNCDAGNTRSVALAKRLGFAYEGTLRSSYPLNGQRLDTAVYGLVEGEIDAALA